MHKESAICGVLADCGWKVGWVCCITAHENPHHSFASCLSTATNEPKNTQASATGSRQHTYQIVIDGLLASLVVGLLHLRLLEGVRNVQGAGIEATVLVVAVDLRGSRRVGIATGVVAVVVAGCALALAGCGMETVIRKWAYAHRDMQIVCARTIDVACAANLLVDELVGFGHVQRLPDANGRLVEVAGSALRHVRTAVDLGQTEQTQPSTK